MFIPERSLHTNSWYAGVDFLRGLGPKSGDRRILGQTRDRLARLWAADRIRPKSGPKSAPRSSSANLERRRPQSTHMPSRKRPRFDRNRPKSAPESGRNRKLARSGPNWGDSDRIWPGGQLEFGKWIRSVRVPPPTNSGGIRPGEVRIWTIRCSRRHPPWKGGSVCSLERTRLVQTHVRCKATNPVTESCGDRPSDFCLLCPPHRAQLTRSWPPAIRWVCVGELSIGCRLWESPTARPEL